MKCRDLLALSLIALFSVFLGIKLVESLDRDSNHIKVIAEIDLAAFSQRVEEGSQAGKDIYILAKQWDWGGDIELIAGQSYVLHLATQDVAHAFHLPKEVAQTSIDVIVLPGKEYLITLESPKEGIYAIGCTLYCGIEHNKMRGRLIVRK